MQDFPNNQFFIDYQMRCLITRILKLPMATLAVWNGHVIGGGLFFSLGFDFVLAKDDDRIKIHLNEHDHDFGMPLGFLDIMAHRTGNAFGARLLLGHRFSPKIAHYEYFVYDLYKEDAEMMAKIHKFTKSHSSKAEDRDYMRQLKKDLYKDVADKMLDPQVYNLIRAYPKL